MQHGTILHTTTHLYRRQDLIGRGVSCEVYKAIQKTTGRVHALKIYKDLTWSHSSEHWREVEALTRLQHPNIVKFLGHEAEIISGRTVLVMEYCSGGSLLSYLEEPENSHGLNDKDVLLVLSHTTAALTFLRSRGYAHRDIKPGNILRHVDLEGSVIYKLSDFGTSRQLDSSEEFKSLVGTEEYLHPDMYKVAFVNNRQATAFSGAAVDLWSLACTFFHIIVGVVPFKPFEGTRSNRGVMFEMVTYKPRGAIGGIQTSKNGPVQWYYKFPSSCQISEDLGDLMTRVLVGLLATESRDQWTFEKFQAESQNILTSQRIALVITDNATCVTLYMPSNFSLAELQDEVARQTDVPADRQLLFYREKALREVESNCVSLPDLFSSTEQEPVLFISESVENGKSSDEQLGYNPVFCDSCTAEQDLKVAQEACVFVYNVTILVAKVVTVQRGLFRATICMWSRVEYVLVRTRKTYQRLSLEVRELFERLEMMQEIERRNRKCALTLDSSLYGKIKKGRSKYTAMNQKLHFVDYQLSVTKKNVSCLVVEDGSTLAMCNQECVEKTEELFRRSKEHMADIITFRKSANVSEYDVALAIKSRKDLMELCARSSSQWQDHCYPNKVRTHQLFLAKKREFLKQQSILRKIDTTLSDLKTDVQHFKEMLSEIWAFTGKSLKEFSDQLVIFYQDLGTENHDSKLLLEESQKRSKDLDVLLSSMPDVSNSIGDSRSLDT